MTKQLKVYRTEEGEPAVKCPRCDEVIIPIKAPMGLDGYDCSECNQVIESAQLATYRKVLRAFDDGEWE